MEASRDLDLPRALLEIQCRASSASPSLFLVVVVAAAENRGVEASQSLFLCGLTSTKVERSRSYVTCSSLVTGRRID
ncbi:unnamed protein product, partial [Mesorhabditis belari]|uniref:Uncharacterized protein n=1 Tax=Mesorhabditis belari TaxID=2138241 RepID=A0AAF3EN67_9BILA